MEIHMIMHGKRERSLILMFFMTNWRSVSLYKYIIPVDKVMSSHGKLKDNAVMAKSGALFNCLSEAVSWEGRENHSVRGFRLFR